MNGGFHWRFLVAQTEKKFFAVLRKKSRAGLHETCLAARIRFDGDASSNRVAVTFCASQTKDNRGSEFGLNIFQQANLRAAAIFQQHFDSAVVIEIGEGESSAVFDKIQSENPRDVRKRSVAVVHIKNIPFKTAPSSI